MPCAPLQCIVGVPICSKVQMSVCSCWQVGAQTPNHNSNSFSETFDYESIWVAKPSREDGPQPEGYDAVSVNICPRLLKSSLAYSILFNHCECKITLEHGVNLLVWLNITFEEAPHTFHCIAKPPDYCKFFLSTLRCTWSRLIGCLPEKWHQYKIT